jgi:metal-sulfur cluster biosynthetic enzyme
VTQLYQGEVLITDKQILDALRMVMHPEMQRNLLELGMIKDTRVKDDIPIFA